MMVVKYLVSLLEMELKALGMLWYMCYLNTAQSLAYVKTVVYFAQISTKLIAVVRNVYCKNYFEMF